MRRLHVLLAAELLLLLTGSSCVAPGGDVHLEPFFARFTASDGATETEALFGLYRHRSGGHRRRFGDETAAKSQTTIGPLWSHDVEPTDALWRSRFLVPFGFASDRGDEARVFLAPIFTWGRRPKLDGSVETRLITLWGWLYSNNSVTGRDFGWFPFYGDIEDFTIFERFSFVLWPLWMRLEADGSVGHHVLWPFFAWTSGTGKRGFHVWPLIGRSHHPGIYDRWFFLWPFFHYHENQLHTSRPERKWLAWPLIGHTSVGTYSSWTWLWPFFGYAHDTESGFWALDFPWFFVRIQRGPGEVTRTRFWPLFGYLKAGSLEAWSYLWPLGHYREERYPRSERDSSWFIPIWQRWVARDLETGARSSWWKIFPLFQVETADNWKRGSFPTLDPFPRNEIIDRHFSWLWKLWEWETDGARRHERSLAGVVRREAAPRESRTSVSGLWSGRRLVDERGAVSEHSLLFGLLRWRVTEADGFDMLRPAFPGPGWPAEWTDAEEPDESRAPGAPETGGERPSSGTP